MAWDSQACIPVQVYDGCTLGRQVRSSSGSQLPHRANDNLSGPSWWCQALGPGMDHLGRPYKSGLQRWKIVGWTPGHRGVLLSEEQMHQGAGRQSQRLGYDRDGAWETLREEARMSWRWHPITEAW